MLPSVPNSFGRLSDAYLSAYLAVQGKSSPLNLPTKKSYAVILVDGLGVENIRSAGAHAGFLNRAMANSKSLFSGFPSTTATSLASLATGKQNGEHAFIGYRVYDREKQLPINLLNDLGDRLEPRSYQNLPTISELAVEVGLSPVTVGPSEYAQSGFTKATMPASKYLAGKTMQERFEIAARELSNPGTLIYLYIPELDQAAHRFGLTSNNWLELVEELDANLGKFSKAVPRDAGVILTADHGVIDVPKSSHIYLDEYNCLSNLLMIGGDPRVGFVYFPEGENVEVKKQEIESKLSRLLTVATVEELVSAGWLAEFSASAKSLAPDLVLLPKGDKVLYHRDFAKAKSMEMIGQHGGLSRAEWEVPLIVF